MPAWLLWLMPPLVGTAGAIAWTAWSGRAGERVDPNETVAAHDRFRSALAAGRAEPAATVRVLPAHRAADEHPAPPDRD